MRMLVLAAGISVPMTASAATITVDAGGDLQAAINAAQPGDTILLQPGATYAGNFKLPVHGGTTYITIRSAAPDALLPPAGMRISPAYSPYLPKLASPNSVAAVRTAPGAAFWRLQFLELDANDKGQGDIIMLGDGSAAQSTLEHVPHHLIVDRVYLHGDPLHGQKRGIGLNSAQTTIVNSYMADIKAIGIDTQVIAGWNGPGPYRLENNYLEGGTEVVLFGGDDPKIPNLTPTDLIVRNNTLTRPVSWRDPIVQTPSGVRAVVTADGTLPAGTYGYRVVAQRPAGTATARSNPSVETAVTVSGAGRVTLQWNTVPDATAYVVYGRTPGAQTRYWSVTSTTFVDDGTMAGAAGTPAKASFWQVKNLFELKNAQRVQVDHNVMENNWQHAQNGFAILFTPRNQYGACTWCVVRDVTFEDNVVRHVGGGINLLGQDYLHPSLVTTNIVIRNNEFSDINKTAWGGSGYFMTISDQPGKVVVDHNTIISPSGGGVITVAGDPIAEFEFTNNVARHNTYGIFGAGVGTGNAALARYFPGAVVARNVFSGGNASKYPAGNEFPSAADFEAHFADYAGADYALRSGTNWERTATDGLDLGAAVEDLRISVAGAIADPPQIVTASLPSATEFDAYAANVEVTGGLAPYAWSLLAGGLPAGVVLDPIAGTLSGSAAVEGSYPFTIQVRDASGATVARPLSLHVNKYIPPVAIVTAVIPNAVSTAPFAASLQAIGGLGSYVWTIASGALPAGLSLSVDGTLSGTTTQQGLSTVVVTASDASDPARAASRSYAIVVEPPPNVLPSVTMGVAGSLPAALGTKVTLSASAIDVDGFITRVEYHVDGVLTSTVMASPFTAEWLVTTPGPHRVVATAWDNGGGLATSAEFTLDTKSEVVLYASDVARMAGNYQVVADTTAAGGQRLWNPNLSAPKLSGAAAAPVSYVEFTFYAEAGRPYQLWIRGKAEKNSWANDSVFVQFDHLAGAEIGTSNALTVQLEDDINAGVSGWGWQDHGWGAGIIGTPLVFTHAGMQTVRIQPREDGLSIDQIVFSATEYLGASPGALKNDATILQR
jgi:hypothetical protein